MEKEMINQLIDTAIHQLKYSYTPYSILKQAAALLQKMGRFTQAATLKMPGTQPQTVRERTAFFKT